MSVYRPAPVCSSHVHGRATVSFFLVYCVLTHYNFSVLSQCIVIISRTSSWPAVKRHLQSCPKCCGTPNKVFTLLDTGICRQDSSRVFNPLLRGGSAKRARTRDNAEQELDVLGACSETDMGNGSTVGDVCVLCVCWCAVLWWLRGVAF